MPHHNLRPEDILLTRREALLRCGMGMGTIGLAGLLSELGLLAAAGKAAPLGALAPKTPHFAPKAKRVIHLFMNGGPSHVDTFDPKPMLGKYHGRALPVIEKYQKALSRVGGAMQSPFRFEKYGRSGMDVSELFPHFSNCVDDVALIRSMYTDSPSHNQGILLMNTGETRLVRPCLGSWVTYGLGTENQNLPGFIALCPSGYPLQGALNWQSGFLPGVYQGTYVNTEYTDISKLVRNIRNQFGTRESQRKQLDLLQKLNERHMERRGQDSELEARLVSFEIAYRMQVEATDAFDVSKEPQHIRDMYGPGDQARSMLIARRLVERGVRFVQVWHGDTTPWDSHTELESNHRRLAKETDQGIAALLKDLNQRGMLDDTLVIWGGEFGRTPTVELIPNGAFNTSTGRDHNHWGFTMWMAGGGVKRGYIHGETDELGFEAVKDKMHVHDLHATILWLLGFDHEKLTFHYAGRDFRLTDVHGTVVKELIG